MLAPVPQGSRSSVGAWNHWSHARSSKGPGLALVFLIQRVQQLRPRENTGWVRAGQAGGCGPALAIQYEEGDLPPIAAICPSRIRTSELAYLSNSISILGLEQSPSALRPRPGSRTMTWDKEGGALDSPSLGTVLSES